jgi:hypothetical protein
MSGPSPDRKGAVRALCKAALGSVNDALAGKVATSLSSGELTNIRSELHQMMTTLDPRIYHPSYARFLGDSYQGGDKLTDSLLELSYQYSQRLK